LQSQVDEIGVASSPLPVLPANSRFRDEAREEATVSSIGIGAIVFACVFGGAMFGMFIRTVLPEHHLSTESKDVVKLGIGLVATMCALVLGLLVSSAKSYYDTQNNELTEMSSGLLLLDRVLAHYGPEAKEIRGMLRSAVSDLLDHMWSKHSTSTPQSQAPSGEPEVLLDKIQDLSPKDDKLRTLQAQAVGLMLDLKRMRWLQYVQGTSSISNPLLVILVFWLTVIFISFGLYAPANATVVTSLFVAALSVSVAVLLILALYTPYRGLIRISSAPLVEALAHMGK
jgi:hypothetical protein